VEGSGRYHRIIEWLYNDTLLRNNYLNSIEKINLVAISRKEKPSEKRLEVGLLGKWRKCQCGGKNVQRLNKTWRKLSHGVN